MTALLDEVEKAAKELASEYERVADASVALVRVPISTAASSSRTRSRRSTSSLLHAVPKARIAVCVPADASSPGDNGGAAFGDYAAGSNHVLPTGGAARFAGPLGVATFRRRQALVSLPDGAARALAPHVSSLARAEGFPVHAASAEARAGDRDKDDLQRKRH